MARSTINIVEKDGFVYQQRKTSIDNGDTSIGTVDVLSPSSLENLSDAITAGLETEANALACYIAGKAVQVQREARTAKKGGKVPAAAQERIYAGLDKEFKTTAQWPQVIAEIAKVYAAENA